MPLEIIDGKVLVTCKRCGEPIMSMLHQCNILKPDWRETFHNLNKIQEESS